MTRFGAAMERIDERSPGVDLPLLSVSQTKGVIRRSELTDAPQRAESLDTYKVCRANDIVFNKMSIRSGAMGVATEDGLVTYHYEVMRPRASTDSRFIVYLMKSAWFTEELIKRERGIGAGDQANVRTTEVPFSVLRTIDAYIPDEFEQRAIADFLDRETAQIDELIAEQQRLIGLLQERRAAVVDGVVTAGLDPSVPTRETGVPWIGSIPAHWKLRPLWSMFERKKDVDHPQEQMLSVFRDHGVVAKDSRHNINQTAENRSIYQLVHPGWLVTNRMKAWQGSVGISSLRGIVSGHYICFEPLHSESNDYLNWAFRSGRYATGYRLISRGVRNGQAEIDNDNYRVMPVIVPPRQEQEAIAAFLHTQIEKIDQLTSEAERFIELVQERRSALITAAVTGQIGVRDIA